MRNPGSLFFGILILLLTIAAAVSLFAGDVRAESSRDLVSEGNRAFEAGEFEEALDRYQKASVDEPESPYLFFNEGAVRYRMGDYARAEELFEKAALASKDVGIEAKAKFNLGNCRFREGELKQKNDPEGSLKDLEASIRHYRESLRLDPEMEDAAQNIEIARLKMKQLLDEIKKRQEEMEKQQKQQKQLADNIKELIKRQKNILDETGKVEKALSDKENQAPDAADRKELDRLADEQAELKDDTKKLSEDVGKNAQSQGQLNPAHAKIGEHLERSADAQEKADEPIRAAKPDQAKPKEQESLDELNKALEALQENSQQCGSQKEESQQQNQQQNRQQEQNEQNQESRENQNQEMKQDQQKKSETAQAILDEEKENRDRRRKAEQAAGILSSDKDW